MINTKLVQKLKDELKNDLPRLQHSLAVAKKAVELANRYACVSSDLEICAFFHDVCKNYNKQDYLTIMPRRIYYKLAGKEPVLLHGYGAYYYLKKYGIKDKELLRAVKYHTTGHKSFKIISKILFLADKIDETRTYEEVGYLRELSLVSLEHCILAYYGFNKQLLAQKNKTLHKLSIQFLKKLTKEVIND